MTEVEHVAAFGSSAEFQDLSLDTLWQLKMRVVDTVGVAIAATEEGGVLQAVLENTLDFGGHPLCTLIGGTRTSPDRAAFFNGVLVRYLDFSDSYIAPGETFHPSDNFGAILAAAEYADVTGQTFLTALAVAYQVQACLSEAAPVRRKGFDHTTQGAYAVAAGVSRALGLDQKRTAHALAMGGVANNALRVTRTGALSNWKGIAFANMAFAATHSTFLAMRGITGPLEIFEGNKGFQQAISGPFAIDWEIQNFEKINHSIIKRYNAEIHSQSALEAALELQQKYHFTAKEIQDIEVEVFQVAFDIIGGGEEGDKTLIRTKEEADHSLPYMLAVALIDGDLYPKQYLPARILSADVQNLLQKVHVAVNPQFTSRFPKEMPAKVTIRLRDGRELIHEKSDYLGFYTRPMSWEQVVSKFRRVTEGVAARSLQDSLIQVISDLENFKIRELTRLLAQVTLPKERVAS